MKKIVTGTILLADLCLLILTSLLVILIPGLLDRSLAMDKQTIFRIMILYAILFLFIFTLLLFPHQKKGSIYSLQIAKVQHYFLSILYIFCLIFVTFIASHKFIRYFNFIPFRTILLRGYDFLSMPEEFGLYSLFRTIFFYILYPIPICIALRKSKIKNGIRFYFISVFLFLLFMESLYFIFNSSFDVDHILLGLYGAYLANLIEKSHLFASFFGWYQENTN